jgi:uncharacterized protein (DUF2252 family)
MSLEAARNPAQPSRAVGRCQPRPAARTSAHQVGPHGGFAFGFFRGAVPLMAADLASFPTTGITVQICGDAHVRNLGAFASPIGAVRFDINDFDETMPGPWEWDVKRQAASLVLSGREAAHSDGACKEAVESFVAEYRKSVNLCSELTVLEMARYTVHRRREAGPLPKLLAKAERATPQHTLEKLTQSRGSAQMPDAFLTSLLAAECEDI